MDFHFLSDVRPLDGAGFGELRHLVCDPDTGTVLSIVVQQASLDGTAVVVPIERVRRADDDGVYVDMSEDEFAHLPPYAYGQNLAPPPAEYDPAAETTNFDEEPIEVADVPPIGAAAGITSIAFTPIIDVHRNIPEGAIIVDDMTVVQATDGDIGKVTDVAVDDASHAIAQYTVESGFLVKHSHQVPSLFVIAYEPDLIRLNVDKTTAIESSAE